MPSSFKKLFIIKFQKVLYNTGKLQTRFSKIGLTVMTRLIRKSRFDSCFSFIHDKFLEKYLPKLKIVLLMIKVLNKILAIIIYVCSPAVDVHVMYCLSCHVTISPATPSR